MRDPTYELNWIEAACRHAGLTGLTERFSEQVFARLQKGAREYGENSFMERGHGLTTEIAEEATDLTAWSVLAAQFVRAEVVVGRLHDDEAMMIQARLLEAAAHSLRAWSAIAAARDMFSESLHS